MKSEGIPRTPEKRVYYYMRARCLCSTNKDYGRYGGRGIAICDRWLRRVEGFQNFLADMGARPSDLHMLDRIDNDGGYSPENCRWVLMKDQVRNREVTLKVNGVPLAEIAERAGMKYSTAYSRHRAGKPVLPSPDCSGCKPPEVQEEAHATKQSPSGAEAPRTETAGGGA